jgi:hypothetical protein
VGHNDHEGLGGQKGTLELSAPEIDILRRELTDAREALDVAIDAASPFEALGQMTWALDTLTATQHELVNVLLDRGATWSQVADALSTSSAVARRRFPRRESRSSATDQPQEAGGLT